MAMGTIPVVAPDVDMTHYADPPVADIHYIRLETFDPSEVKNLLTGFGEQRWRMMSECAHKWWLKNCSAEGMWNLTKSLVE